jgi:hypothetical protein
MLKVNDASADLLSRLLKLCPVCSEALSNDGRSAQHSYALFATTIAKEENVSRLTAFFEAAKAHNWKALHSFADWDAMETDLEASVIRCGEERGALVIVRNPSELYEPEQVYLVEQLSAVDIKALNAMQFKTDWKRI